MERLTASKIAWCHL